MSTRSWQPDFQEINGDDDVAAMSVWDGDDMTLDMVTEAEDENVDEEVSTLGNTSVQYQCEPHHLVSRLPSDTSVTSHEETTSLQATPRTRTGVHGGPTPRTTS
jgi:hypothetical protein